MAVYSDFALPEDNWDLESDSSGLSSYSEEEGEELVDKEMNKYMKTMDEELLNTDVPRTSVDNPNRKVCFIIQEFSARTSHNAFCFYDYGRNRCSVKVVRVSATWKTSSP